jgi:hypothetical protein
MTNYERRLMEWSNKVVNYCHDKATNPDYNLDLSFHAFQSVPKESPELLLLGINPGREYAYADQFNNPIWGLIEEKRMTAEVFVKANPTIADLKTWRLWNNLSKAFYSERMNDILSSSMLMNLIYFNTVKVENLLAREGGKEVYDMCRDFSIELITDIIKPKRVLCLGTAGCFDLLPIKDETRLIQEKRLLVKGQLAGIPVYGIPHPSGSRTFYPNRKHIGEILSVEFCQS